MKITVVAYICTYGGASVLAKAMSQHTEHDVTLIYHDPDRYDFHLKYDGLCWADDPAGCVERLLDADVLLFAGTPSVWRFMHQRIQGTKYGGACTDAWLKKKPTFVLVTDTWFYREPQKHNSILSKYRVYPFIMPDLLPYLQQELHQKYCLYYQSIEEPETAGLRAKDRIILCHSPGHPLRYAHKGTPDIVRIFDTLHQANRGKVDWQLITGMKHDKCLRAKAAAHIFVDQIVEQPSTDGFPEYHGGVGKSGLEAMRLGCVTLASGSLPPDMDIAFAPPAIRVDKNSLLPQLERLIASPELLTEVSRQQLQWAKTYTTPQYVASHVTKWMEQEG